MCKVITITGCSASGKDTIFKEVLTVSNYAKPIISTTTRPIRNGEVEGREYHFIDTKKAIEKIQKNEFVETREYKVANGDIWIYGIEKSRIDIHSKNIYIVILDLQGLRQLEEYVGKDNIFSIYIDTTMQERILRSMSREGCISDDKCLEVCRRMIADNKEVASAKDYCNITLRNEKKDDARDCVKFIKMLVEGWRK